MSASPTHSAAAESAVSTSLTSSDAVFPEMPDDWPAEMDAPLFSGCSTPPPLLPDPHPIASLTSPGVRQILTGTARPSSSARAADAVVPTFSVMGTLAQALTFTEGPASTSRGARNLSETMESMDFAAQLERLSEKDLEALWAALWSNMHSLQALNHAVAGPQTGWNPYRAARGGPHLRKEIMNSQLAEFKNVIPRDSLYLLGTAIRKPVPTKPPGSDREAVARRRRAELDELVRRSGGTSGGLHTVLGAAVGEGGHIVENSPELPTTPPAPAGGASDTAPLTAPVVWTMPPTTPLSLTGTPAVVHTPAETERLLDGACQSSVAARVRVSHLVEEIFASHGRQPQEILAAHCASASVAQLVRPRNDALVPSHLVDKEDVADRLPTCGTTITAGKSDKRKPPAFTSVVLRDELVSRLFDRLWLRVVVPFYTQHRHEADVTPLPELVAAPAISTLTRTAVSPALRPRRVSRRGSAAKTSATSSTSASEAMRNSASSGVESSIILHLRRHSVQEELGDDTVDMAEATARAGCGGGASVTAQSPLSRRHVTYSDGVPTLTTTDDDRLGACSSSSTVRSRSASPQKRAHPRTGPIARRKPSPSTATVLDHLEDVTRTTHGVPPTGRKRSIISHACGPLSLDADENSANGVTHTEPAEATSMHMEDLDDVERNVDHGCARPPTQPQRQHAHSTSQAPTRLQRAANQSLGDTAVRRRGPTGGERFPARRAPHLSNGTGTKTVSGALRLNESSPYFDAEHRNSRRAATGAAPRIGRPTSVGDKPLSSGRLRGDPLSQARDASPLGGGEARAHASPPSRRARVGTAQVHTHATLSSSRPRSSFADHRVATMVMTVSEGNPISDTEKLVEHGEGTARVGRSGSPSGGGSRRGLPVLDGSRIHDKRSTAVNLAGGAARRGQPRGVQSASTRAPRAAGTERPVTEHGSLSPARRQYTRQPVSVRALEGTSRGPSPLASGKRPRNVKPLDPMYSAYASQS